MPSATKRPSSAATRRWCASLVESLMLRPSAAAFTAGPTSERHCGRPEGGRESCWTEGPLSVPTGSPSRSNTNCDANEAPPAAGSLAGKFEFEAAD
jgi:hypothetical protein